MTDETLLTVLQVSDLHFGDLPNGLNPGALSAPVPSLIPVLSYLDGWLGHHWQGVSDLHRFHRELLRRDPGALVVVSGDVTASGAVQQFALADGFLGAVNGGSRFGRQLGLADWAERAVPGNHDQWPGMNTVVGPPTAGLNACFPIGFPFVGPRLPLAYGFSVRFVFVDSDADVPWFSLNRLMARGSFVRQLAALDEAIPAVVDKEVRVMVIHHAIADASVPEQGRSVAFPQPPKRHPRILEIEPNSLRVLEHALVDHGIKVVMTGHLHVPRLTELEPSNGNERTRILEARCGTTTQRDRYPYSMLRQMGKGRLLPPNTLILHEAVLRDDQILWKAQVFWRAAGSGFVLKKNSVSPHLNWKLSRQLPISF